MTHPPPDEVLAQFWNRHITPDVAGRRIRRKGEALQSQVAIQCAVDARGGVHAWVASRRAWHGSSCAWHWPSSAPAAVRDLHAWMACGQRTARDRARWRHRQVGQPRFPTVRPGPRDAAGHLSSCRARESDDARVPCGELREVRPRCPPMAGSGCQGRRGAAGRLAAPRRPAGRRHCGDRRQRPVPGGRRPSRPVPGRHHRLPAVCRQRSAGVRVRAAAAPVRGGPGPRRARSAGTSRGRSFTARPGRCAAARRQRRSVRSSPRSLTEA